MLSSLSRSLWTQTWLVALLAISLYLVCRSLKLARRPPMVLLATCTALMYFVRPTAVVPILAITALVWVYWRGRFLSYAVTGALWAVVFALFSDHIYGSWLPPYYQQHLSGSDTFLEALAGTLFSPSRGWMLYTPCILLLCFLPSRVAVIRERAVLTTSLVVMVVHWVLVSSWAIWWGGYSYGPRLMADIVPWLFLAGVLLWDAWLRKPPQPALARMAGIVTFVVVGFSLYANLGGAYGEMAIQWNKRPVSVDAQPQRVWDWKDPQFVAGPYLLPEWPARTPQYESVQ